MVPFDTHLREIEDAALDGRYHASRQGDGLRNGMERLQRGNLNLYEPSPYDNERLTNKS